MRYSTGKLYCFSPPIMLLTIAIEVSLLIYTLWRYTLTPITKIVAALLFFLAMFQVAEYNVCGRFNLDAETWSRIGYVSITMLPPLGLHLIQKIAKRGWFWLKWAAYMNAFLWCIMFGFSAHAFKTYSCGGNYVIFQLAETAGKAYFAYYYFWLFVSIVLAVTWALQTKIKSVRKALLLYVVSYAVFIVPTTIINNLYPATRSAIPSVMCGFAVFYALMVVLIVLPLIKLETKHKLDKQ